MSSQVNFNGLNKNDNFNAKIEMWENNFLFLSSPFFRDFFAQIILI